MIAMPFKVNNSEMNATDLRLPFYVFNVKISNAFKIREFEIRSLFLVRFGLLSSY